jgi:hypothetical protein
MHAVNKPKMRYEKVPVVPREGEKYVQPLSFGWRLSHTLGYILGGTTFLLGSIQYYPWISNYSLGGWLFTIGSAGLVISLDTIIFLITI